MLSSTKQVFLVLACVAVSCQAQGNYLEDDDYVLPSRPAYRPPARPAPTQPSAPKPTPVPIIKQINRHNEDGSYTYGYEGADGSFKIETKLTTGEVMGKYGYVDDVGKVRVVEYGANKYGFMPQGEGITVAPPTLVDETTSKEAIQEQQRSRLYLDDDRVRYVEDERPRAASRPAPPPAPRPVFVPEERVPTPVYRAPAAQPAPYKPASYKPAAPAYRPPPKASSGPVPHRAVIQGAAQIEGSRPAPVYEEQRVAPQPAYRPPPPAQPAYRPPPPQAHQPARDTFAHARSSPSILDQLEKDYALPQSGHRYHDVSFGSF